MKRGGNIRLMKTESSKYYCLLKAYSALPFDSRQIEDIFNMRELLILVIEIFVRE